MKLMDVVVDAAMDAAMDNYYITSHVQSACIGQDDAALDAAKVSYNIKKGFHIMDPLFARCHKICSLFLVLEES